MKHVTVYKNAQLVVLLTVLFPLFVNADAGNLKPFTSDGCSAFPDGTITQNNLWLHCCRAHDFDYWQGGTAKQRSDSDKRLRACVAKVDQPAIAALMLAGVRVGGTPYLPTSFRWGYGWAYPRFYGELTAEEIKLIKEKSSNSH